MMNKNNWKKKLLIVSIISFIIVIFIRLITPQESVVEKTTFINTNRDNEKTTFSQIYFVGQSIKTPKKISSLGVQFSSTTVDDIKDNLIQKYQLKRHPSLNTLWTGESYSLSYNNINDEYTFSKKSYIKPNLVTDVNKAIKSAETFISEVFPNIETKTLSKNIRYLHGEIEMHLGERNEANAVEIPFTYSINSIPVFIDHKPAPLFSVIFNAEYEVQKIVFQSDLLAVFPTDNSLSTISIEKAIENINNEQAVIINSYSDDGALYSIKDIKSGDLEKVSFEYRVDTKEAIGYPFYRFSGELVNNEGKTIQAEIITPAVKISE